MNEIVKTDPTAPVSFWENVGHRAAVVDLRIVRAASRSARRPGLRTLAVTFTRLGDGWVYPILSVVVMLRWGLAGARILVSSFATAALLHSLYPIIKRRVLRARPFVADTQLECLAAPLDRYSFPSGHTMTLTGVFVPVAVYWHAALPAGLVMGACLAWSRLATAHHYLSDVLAGVLLGVAVGYPVAKFGHWLW